MAWAPPFSTGVEVPPSWCNLAYTPSGNALRGTVFVRNISNDPLAPCYIFWPDNEPVPLKSQIRP
ncbi:hypothetical protein AURDEDRAFT_76383, partial [Auricularia subglabra TFB-10046 SS5]